MPELYERVTGNHATLGKIPAHTLMAVIAEQQDVTITPLQAKDIITFVSGDPLGVVGEQEVADLVATIQAGTTAANRGVRAERMNKIHRVLLLLDQQALPYTPAFARTTFGVPTR